ncbi:MAG: hypothetical protein AMS27_00465 [Bacteroides sp. SM23_62_1]|nr:MAG: hypothetical protein AMS27_00465 [Bacteroides sp. SM23_62_1]
MPLIVILGLPATGKSYLARELIKSLSNPPIYLNTDQIRRALFDFSHHQYLPFGNKLYTQEKRDLVYNALYMVVEILLGQKLSLLVDGTFYSQAKRQPLIQICQKLNQKYYIIKTTCSEDLVKQRIQERKSQNNNASDADFNIYLEIKERFEKINIPYLEIDTGKELPIFLKEVIQYIANI